MFLVRSRVLEVVVLPGFLGLVQVVYVGEDRVGLAGDAVLRFEGRRDRDVQSQGAAVRQIQLEIERAA